VEMTGVEPVCKDIGTYTSTSVVNSFTFAHFFSLLTGMEAASLIILFLHPQTVELGVVHYTWVPYPTTWTMEGGTANVCY